MRSVGIRVLWFSVGVLTSITVMLPCVTFPPQSIKTTSVGPVQLSDPIFQKSTCNKDDCSFRITPRTIVIHFVDKDEYKHTAPMPSLAYSKPYQEPCEAFIPAIATINSNPGDGTASWGFDTNSYETSKNIAHEILHCYTGPWHGDRLALNLHYWHRTLAESTTLDRDPRLFRYRLPKLSRQLYDKYDWNKLGQFYYPDEYITVNHGEYR